MSKKDALIQPDRGQDAIAIHLVTKDKFEAWLKPLSIGQRAALKAQKFEAKPFQVGIVPDGDGWFAAGGVGDPAKLTSWCLAKLAEDLPGGTYRLADGEPGAALHGWQTAQYRFTRYLKPDDAQAGPRILLSKQAKGLDEAIAEAEAENLVRDLVNTPAEDMGPAALEAVCEKLAKTHDAKLQVVKGDVLERDFPMVHAVGRAAARHHAPRLIHLTWGKEKHPVLAVVGKGVCFDSGGLDIKPASGMKLMKKDMGGAAHAIALARLIMTHHLPVRLHLLIPAVENAIAGNAFRPGDVLSTRKGLSVEIGNTDAEGRLVLGDALTKAGEDAPELVIDFATLTGAARVALGPDLPALFANDDDLAHELYEAGKAVDDPIWQLPLWGQYEDMFKSDIADIANAGEDGFAGAITAALFLQKFAPENAKWAHFDTFAWRPSPKPGRPKGGEALGLRAAFAVLEARYARK